MFLCLGKDGYSSVSGAMAFGGQLRSEKPTQTTGFSVYKMPRSQSTFIVFKGSRFGVCCPLFLLSPPKTRLLNVTSAVKALCTSILSYLSLFQSLKQVGTHLPRGSLVPSTNVYHGAAAL